MYEREEIIMDDEIFDTVIDTPDSCVEPAEYFDIRIDEAVEIEPDEEPEDEHVKASREEAEQRFARYERNYRARRIRELTSTTQVRRVPGHKSGSGKIAA